MKIDRPLEEAPYSPARLANIQNLYVHFSKPLEFNDTFDSDYRVADRKMSMHRYKHRNSLGVFCLTEDPDSHLMWVNYAKQHTGFVIGFNTSDDFFSANGVVPTKVTYADAPPPPVSALTPPVDLSAIKSRDWDYEREWRSVRVFDKNESRDISFEPTVISEVILGSKTEPHHISQLLELVSAFEDTYPIKIPVFESKSNRDTWKFTHVPSTLIHCTHCSGNGYLRDKSRATTSIS